MAYTQHSWMLIDIVVGLSVRPSVRLFVYGIFRWLCIWDFFFFLPFFFCLFFSKVRVGANEGGSHYWEMAVAITCGYGGYLLPLLAAHSSYSLLWCMYFIMNESEANYFSYILDYAQTHCMVFLLLQFYSF